MNLELRSVSTRQESLSGYGDELVMTSANKAQPCPTSFGERRRELMGVSEKNRGIERKERGEKVILLPHILLTSASPPLHTPIHARIHINVRTCKVQMHAVKYTSSSK